MFKQIKNFVQNLNVSNTFIFAFLISSKLNNLFHFKINFVLLFIFCLFVTIFLNSVLIRIGNFLKNTFFFNYLFLMKLSFQNLIFKNFFSYVEYLKDLKEVQAPKSLYFGYGFIISFYTIYLSFFILLKSIDNVIMLNVLLILIFFNSIFNLIEKRLIFNEENLKNTFSKKDFVLNSNYIQNLLKVDKNLYLNKRDYFYIQKHYMHNNEF